MKKYILHISQNSYNVDVRSLLAAFDPSWNGIKPVDVTVQVDPGVAVGSMDTSAYSLLFRNFNTKSKIVLINKGYIVGRGGDGRISGGGDAPGYPGGPALYVAFPISIDNSAGIIGGGGGGGSAWEREGDGNDLSGGGGAGFPAGNGGPNWDVRGSQIYAQPGTLTTGGNGGYISGLGYGCRGGDLGQGGLSADAAGGPPGIAIYGESLITWVAQGTVLGQRVN
jgi:hypothetical protein